MINILGNIKKEEMKRKAFSLAEVLITLAVIGFVAALTIPVLTAKYKEKIAYTRLKQAYSLFSQAYLRVVTDNGPVEIWDIDSASTPAGAAKLYALFKPYLSTISDCDTDEGCFSTGTYKSLFGSSYAYQPRTHAKYARGILANGISVAFWSGGTGCSLDFSKNGTGVYADSCGAIYADINGSKNPNQAGVDYFKFIITAKGIFPAGEKDYADGYNAVCEYQNTSKTNGAICTAYFLQKGRMDYLKQDISDFFSE